MPIPTWYQSQHTSTYRVPILALGILVSCRRWGLCKWKANCQHPLDHRKSRRISEKSNYASPTTLKPLTVWATTNCGKFLKRWEYPTTLPASWEICMHVKKQWLELDMEQQTVSKLGKEYIKAVYCHPAYLTYMQSTYKYWAGRSTSWNQDCWEKYQ